MLIGLVGLTLGLLVGAYFPGFVPSELSVYVAVAILACFDSIVGGLVAKFEKSYDDKIFISGFCINAVLAAVFIYFGKVLGIDLSIAVIVVFGSRIFNNFAKMRRILLNFDHEK